jgi:hypothetical protein
MAGRSWPSLTSDVREHEWIGVDQLRLDHKRRRRASIFMRPPYCLVNRLNVAGGRRRVEECAVVVSCTGVSPSSATEGPPYLRKSRPIGPRECADAPPFVSPSCAPRTALVHRSVAAAEYITDPMMQLITSGNVQSESTSWLFIPIRG